MTLLDPIPTWLLQPVAVGLVIYVLGLHYLNRGNKEVVVLNAQDEVVAMALGGAIIVLVANALTGGVLPTVPEAFWLIILAAGTLLALAGVLARFTDWYDIEGLV